MYIGQIIRGFFLPLAENLIIPPTPYVLLRPASYALNFCENKDPMKIYNLGKFHWNSICDCQFINFQNFLYPFNIHEMTLLQGFWTLNPPNMVQNC